MTGGGIADKIGSYDFHGACRRDRLVAMLLAMTKETGADAGRSFGSIDFEETLRMTCRQEVAAESGSYDFHGAYRRDRRGLRPRDDCKG